MPNYIICTAQRSGKTWLVRALTQMQAGQAMEFVTMLHRQHPQLLAAWRSGGVEGFVQACVEMQEAAAFAAGITLHWNDFRSLASGFPGSPAQLLRRIQSALGEDTRIIYLKRRDVVAQAVSHYLMSEGGVAHSFQDGAASAEGRSAPYDREKIDRFRNFTEKAYRGWNRTLRNTTHLQILYEDISSSPTASLRMLLSHIGLAENVSEASLKAALQGTSPLMRTQKSELVRRYLEETS